MEDYFTKPYTFFTTFEGKLRHIKFVVQKLDDHNLEHIGSDSLAVK